MSFYVSETLKKTNRESSEMRVEYYEREKNAAFRMAEVIGGSQTPAKILLFRALVHRLNVCRLVAFRATCNVIRHFLIFF